MGPGTLNGFLDAIAQSVASGQAALIPYGEALALTFAAFSVMAFGWAIFGGHASMVPAIARMSGASGLVVAGIPFWPRLTADCLSGARQAIGLVTHGYDGPTTLFSVAQQVVGRYSLEATATLGLSPWSWWQALNLGLDSFFALVGLSLTGLWAVGSEFELLIGACMAPLILPFLCFSVTAPLGWGAISFLVYGSMRVATLGIASYILAQAIIKVLDLPGTDQALTGEQLSVLLLLSLATLVMGWTINRVASALITGGIGNLGPSSIVTAAGGMMAGMTLGGMAVGGAGAVASGAATVGSNAASMARSAMGGGGGGGGGSSGGGAGRVTSSGGGGNAFRRGAQQKVSLA